MTRDKLNAALEAGGQEAIDAVLEVGRLPPEKLLELFPAPPDDEQAALNQFENNMRRTG